MRLQAAEMKITEPAHLCRDAERTDRAMDNFVRNKIEQPQADPQGRMPGVSPIIRIAVTEMV